MPRTWIPGRSSPRGLKRTISSIIAPSFPGNSPPCRNYDVGNSWPSRRLWRSGAVAWRQRSILSWCSTDHKNLEHVRTVKRLNSRQTGWVLFFNRFDLSLLYRPGSKNVKPGAFLCGRGAVTWGVEEEVRTASIDVRLPDGSPPNRLFDPVSRRSQGIRWAHTSLLSCDPGVRRPPFVIRQRFWWPSMERGVGEYWLPVLCMPRKQSLPTRQSRPLVSCARSLCLIAPGRTSLRTSSQSYPPSEGNTTVLTVVDRFSKCVSSLCLNCQGGGRGNVISCVP